MEGRIPNENNDALSSSVAYMQKRSKKSGGKLNLLQLCQKREFQETDWRTFTHKVQVNKTMISNLRLHKELEGHKGCVNCIEFNNAGNLLLSGSDDFSIILWDVYKRKKLKTFHTGHGGNIFSVKFLQPEGNMIVSGAADNRIEVREIHSGDVTHVCTCHTERVKRIATVPSVPHLFFSASEDGTVLQFDTREKHSCVSQPNNVLINLRTHVGRSGECKCIALHPLKPELIAVGSSDPFIRVYDRKMIKLTSIQYPPGGSGRSPWQRSSYSSNNLEEYPDNLTADCVQYYVPGHLPAKLKDYYKVCRSLATTYLTYNADGTKLMANLGSDHIYLFDTVKSEVPKQYSYPTKKADSTSKVKTTTTTNGLCKHSETNGYSDISAPLNSTKDEGKQRAQSSSTSNKYFTEPLPPRVEDLRIKGNQCYAGRDYSSALEYYNIAISLFDRSPTLFSARAAARIKRKWEGDIYGALKDCDAALNLDPVNERAKYRQVRCLHLLGRDQEAKQSIEYFQNYYPHLCTSPAWNELQKEISSFMSNKKSSSSDEDSDDTVFMRLLPSISAQEKSWRLLAKDYEKVYCGHCNTTTDIKEAVFIGRENEFIAAGSDDGNLFIWDRDTTNLIRVIKADSSIVNCVQSHPNICMLATSGIESVVKLWSPSGETLDEPLSVNNYEEISKKNQQRMNVDPIEMMLLPMDDFSNDPTSRYLRWGEIGNDEDFSHTANNMQCRTS